MFQNIVNDEEQVEVEYKEENIKKKSWKNFFSIYDIVLYAISLMVSMVSFGGDIAPFGLAIFAACCSNQVPAAIIYLCAGIGTTIRFGFKGLLVFFIESLIFIGLTLIFKRKYQDKNRNEKQKLGIYVILSVLIVQVTKMFFDIFLLYDLFTAIVASLVTYIFYKIFVNAIPVVREYGVKAFTIEEVMGASLLLAVAIYSIHGLNVFGLNISNILCIMIVMFLGWKHGMLVGATSGITIGIVIGIVGSSSPVIIASYAISGLLAGLLNRLGKIGVIVGFCLGNALITYFTNGNTVAIITIREILIASLGLLLIPKKINIDIEDIIGKVKFLPTTGGVLEGEKEDTINKLNTVSETISDMARSCNDVAKESASSEDEMLKEAKESFKDELLNNLEDFTQNVLYDDFIENENILDDIYDLLEEKEEITKEELFDIFEKNNNYIIGTNSDDENLEKDVNNDIKNIIKAINQTYRINKLNLVWKQKEAQSKRTLANQLGGVSKVISSIADDMEEENKNEENLETEQEKDKIDPKFKVEITSQTVTKNGSIISGDTFIHTKLRDGKFMMALSDGMGSGEKAKKSSSTVIKMLERLLTTGFDKNVSIGLINSAVKLNSDEETYATIDLSVIDTVNR